MGEIKIAVQNSRRWFGDPASVLRRFGGSHLFEILFLGHHFGGLAVCQIGHPLVDVDLADLEHDVAVLFHSGLGHLIDLFQLRGRVWKLLCNLPAKKNTNMQFVRQAFLGDIEC